VKLIPDFYEVEPQVWNADRSMVKLNFKIHIDGVPFFDSTTASAETYVDKWDQTPGGFMVIRCSVKTYDLPYYSKIFVAHEAWIMMENLDNS